VRGDFTLGPVDLDLVPGETVTAEGAIAFHTLLYFAADVTSVEPGALTLGDLVRRAFLEHKTQADHSDLNAQILKALAGREYYHRIGTEYAPPPP